MTATSRDPLEYTLGLIGYPLDHSYSPKIHQTALQALSLRGTYQLFPIPPNATGDKSIHNLLAAMRSGDIQGLNVTIPHKQKVMGLVDGLTSRAAAIGAVNMVFMDSGKLTGDNTDAPGFWADLCTRLGSDRLRKGSALILGAGGSARAVAYALLNAGLQITIAARRLQQAEEIEKQFPVFRNRITTLDLRSLADLEGSKNLIVNTTPVGMQPHINASPWPAGVPFPEDAAVYDLVYNPIETMLVREAQAAGREAISGLGMLVEQAVLAFERWTGLVAPRDVMMDAAYE